MVGVSRRRTIVIAVAGGIAALLVAGQLALPELAERNLRSSLEELGPDPEVEIAAFPALKLLWGRADRVEVRMRVARAEPAAVTDRLARTADTGELDARVGELRTGPAVLRDVSLRKDGERLRGEGTLREDELRLALPSFVDFRPVATAPGEGLLFEGTVGAFGLEVSAQARLQAVDGAVTVTPEGIPFAGLATFTVFEDPRVRVTSLGAVRDGEAFRLRADGRVD